MEVCLNSKDSIKVNDDNFINILFERIRKLLCSNQPEDSSSALDIAAECGNTDCLKAFLSTDPSKSVDFQMLKTCINFSSVRAFSHLLDHSQPHLFQQSLYYYSKHLHFEAIKVLLQTGDKLSLKQQFSPYHLACVHSRNIHSPQHEKFNVLDQIIALFLKTGFDVNERRFSGQYPLYSLIYSLVGEIDSNPKCVPKHHILALKMLMDAGADPNYNELRAHSDQKNDTERDLFSSAINAFFECLYLNDRWSPINMEYLDQVCLLLLENGANPTHLNSNLESPLHHLMRLTADQHIQGHVSADFFTMTRQLLYFGADPDALLASSSIPITPISYYFKNLFDNMGGHVAYDRWVQKLSQTLPIFNYMHRDVANQSIQVIREMLDKNVSEESGLSADIADTINKTVGRYLGDVRSLEDCCKKAVWQAIGRKAPLVMQLELPKSIIREFNRFFALEI